MLPPAIYPAVCPAQDAVLEAQQALLAPSDCSAFAALAETDAKKAKTDSWVLISTLQAVEATQQQPLALMPPQDGDLAALD